MNGRIYQIEYSSSAQRDLEDLPAAVRMQILRKIEHLQHGLAGNVKRLRDAEAAFRLRLGDFRALFDVEGDVIVVRRVGNRKDIYL